MKPKKITVVNRLPINFQVMNLPVAEKTLRLFNPATGSFLPTMEELAKQATRAEELESEVEKLKAELGKLREQK